MEEAFNLSAAKAYIVERFQEKNDFAFLGEQLPGMVQELLELDQTYIRTSGADNEGVYDDEVAFEYMLNNMQRNHPDYKAYMMRMVDDYMEYVEDYLNANDGIEWED